MFIAAVSSLKRKSQLAAGRMSLHPKSVWVIEATTEAGQVLLVNVVTLVSLSIGSSRYLVSFH